MTVLTPTLVYVTRCRALGKSLQKREGKEGTQWLIDPVLQVREGARRAGPKKARLVHRPADRNWPRPSS